MPQFVKKKKKKNTTQGCFFRKNSLIRKKKNKIPVQNKKAKPESQFRKRLQEKHPESNTYSRSRQI